MTPNDQNGVVRNQGGNAYNYLVTRLRGQVGGGPEGTYSGWVIQIASLNIRSGWSGGLKAVLQALQKGNVGIGVIQDMKLNRGVHTRYRAGYKVWSTEAESLHRDRISIV